MKAAYTASDNNSLQPVLKSYLSFIHKIKETKRLSQPKAKQCMSALESG